VDNWLARVTLQTEVNGSLAATLVLRPEEGPGALEGSLLEFRKVGGRLTIETVFDDNRDLKTCICIKPPPVAMVNRHTRILLVTGSRKLGQEMSVPNPPRRLRTTLRRQISSDTSAFGPVDNGKSPSSQEMPYTGSTFNRDGLMMEVPGRIWSARLGAGSYPAQARRCAGVPFRSLNFLDWLRKALVFAV
jgi:hypothetical protein